MRDGLGLKLEHNNWPMSGPGGFGGADWVTFGRGHLGFGVWSKAYLVGGLNNLPGSTVAFESSMKM